jgi:hypothetical protein
MFAAVKKWLGGAKRNAAHNEGVEQPTTQPAQPTQN